MPEYLSPGVYVEEIGLGSKTIRGVATGVAGFVGPCRFGPTHGLPERVDSWVGFTRIYGGLDPLDHEEAVVTNYLAHAARAYFENGGRRLYVARVFREGSRSGDGRARAELRNDGGASGAGFESRWPGAAGNSVLTAKLVPGPEIVSTGASETADVIETDLTGPLDPEDVLLVCESGSGPEARFQLAREIDWAALSPGSSARVITLSVSLGREDGDGARRREWERLKLHPGHPDSLGSVFADDGITADPTAPLMFRAPDHMDGPATAQALLQVHPPVGPSEDTPIQTLLAGGSVTVRLTLRGGHDGARPTSPDYAGVDASSTESGGGPATGLHALALAGEVSTVAAPGASALGDAESRIAVTRHLIAHCERLRYRVAMLDPGREDDVPDVRAFRRQIDSTRAALYYPWVRAIDPTTETEILLPPSGFVAGIFARNDAGRGVHKAPADLGVSLAVGFERALTAAEQEVLNPEGINALRSLAGRGHRVWGARTISSDPEWKYVNVRRYFDYLERSIDNGTGWAVFEPNAEALWTKVRSTIADFLLSEWRLGRLQGAKPDEAFFVRCDRDTMTQTDLDNGRLICLIGIAPTRPAEFVIFRIGQWTMDRVE